MIEVNVISESSWILGRCAEELRERLGWSINSREPARVDYHVPYWRGLDGKRRPEVRVGFFTHGFDRAKKLAESHFDHAVVMNVTMGGVVSPSVDKLLIAKPGVDAPSRMPVFGVVGRTYRDGRKGEELVEKMLDAGHEVIAIGPGPWPCETLSTDPTRGSEWVEHFWLRIDYLVVTSLDEGGPMPVLEAIARRVPVVAPNVGWCWELPVIPYDTGNWPHLEKVLRDLTVTPTWEEWAEAHRMFFDGLEKEVAA